MDELTMSQFASKDDLLAAQAARIAELEAALEAAREDEWRPIETCPNADRVVMFCDERQNIWTDCAWDRSAAATGFYATHWRPLPAPPAVDQARGNAVGGPVSVTLNAAEAKRCGG
ncbi:hypothetical protein [Coralloluteibacterium thermophilus]|uniref:DUF551 domain-containing protein n=1 Tax=Coralloluteibacterium thermophilum TaxID=2707049 RepID=A0ABV9NIE1_9GAMM